MYNSTGLNWVIGICGEWFLWLRKKLSNQPLLFFIFDSSEELGSQTLDCLWAIERQMRVHLTAIEMAGLATCFENGFDLSCKIHLCR